VDGEDVRSRSVQGLTIMPPKPPLGKVIWKLWLNSGVDVKALNTCSVNGVSCSMVALAGTSTGAEHDALVLGGRQLLG
jgi:hypothetical protein